MVLVMKAKAVDQMLNKWDGAVGDTSSDAYVTWASEVWRQNAIRNEITRNSEMTTILRSKNPTDIHPRIKSLKEKK